MTISQSDIKTIQQLRGFGASYKTISAATGHDYKTCWRYGCNVKKGGLKHKSSKRRSAPSKPQKRHSLVLLKDLANYSKDLNAIATTANEMGLSHHSKDNLSPAGDTEEKVDHGQPPSNPAPNPSSNHTSNTSKPPQHWLNALVKVVCDSAILLRDKGFKLPRLGGHTKPTKSIEPNKDNKKDDFDDWYYPG